MSKFNRDLDGSTSTRGGQSRRDACTLHCARSIVPAMPEKLDVGDWEDPLITMVTLTNLNVPSTKGNERMEGVTAMMLDGYTYPLYKKLRALSYNSVRGVHDKNCVNRWVRGVRDAM